MIDNKVRRQRLAGFSLIELAIVIAIIVIMAVIIAPSVMWSRERARQAHCRNNFRQIGIALQNYGSIYGRFPILGGNSPWSISIAPDLDLRQLFDEYDQNHDPATSATNLDLGKRRISTYMCPSDHEAVVEPNGWRVGNVAMNFEMLGLAPEHCLDGTTNTVAAVEVASERGLAWITGPALFVGVEDSAHDGRFTLLFADGSVRTFPRAVNDYVVRAIGTPNSGEVVDMNW